MTRRRKTLLAAAALVLVLAIGSFAWYWHATAVERRVNAVLNELRWEEPGRIERWLIKFGLMEDPRPRRTYSELMNDLVKMGPSAVPELIRALRDRVPGVRWFAVEALGNLGDARAVEPLVAVLKDEEGDARIQAAIALGSLRDARAVEPLIVTLVEDASARSTAACALGELRDIRAVEPLIAALTDEDDGVRYSAIHALSRLGDARAVPALIESLERERMDEKYKETSEYNMPVYVAAALGQLGDSRALGPLGALLGDEDEHIREAAKEAIERIRLRNEGKP